MPTFEITANRSYALPHSGNDLEIDVDRLRSALSAIDTDIQAALSGLTGKANLSHTHSIGDVSGLQNALDLKLAASAISGAASNLLDDANVAEMRNTLGLGNAALKNTGVSGNNVALLDGLNIWSQFQVFGTGVGGASVFIDGGPESFRYVGFRSAGNRRFSMGIGSAAEEGNNSGSNFFIRRYTDGNVVIDDPLTIDRATGEVTINKLISNDFQMMSGDLFGIDTLIFNHGTPITTRRGYDNTDFIPGAQFHGGSPVNSTIGIFNWGSTDAFGIIMSRSRGGSIGNHTEIQTGDMLGSITFAGSSGNTFLRSAMMSAEAENTAVGGAIRSRIRFHVTDTAGAWNELLRLNSQNNVRLMGGFVEAMLRSNAASGSTVSPTSAVSVVLYDRSATSAALTLRLPTTDVENGQRMKLITRSAISALTVTVEPGVGADIFGAPAALVAGEYVDFIYYAYGPYWVAGK